MGGNTSSNRGRPSALRGGQSGVRGRSFQMTKSKAETTPNVVTGCGLSIQLFPMPMKEFDVVVGIDWLAENRASILYTKKIIIIDLPEKRPIVIYGDQQDHHTNLLSVLKARKCIEKRCQGYLASVIDSKKEKGNQESIPVVCDYPEVFLEDLTGLPPDRSIEFKIDLVPRAAPVARAPYRLAPSELK
ncbi:uncharacterized protein LOC112502702 [Cynara cardunculus var. scolymus]|uniref:uncharacterized protein LOC112502702 n=1 Tax=Cynara cardunculus var. scolymus TaxID=59895 RepID=UPI000D62C8C8|nr:uncharacterized protein LOC112502702 [Cynara cardunculus var. scolymus]